MTLFFATGFTWKRKALLMAIFLAIIGALAGRFLIQRAMESRNSSSFIVRNLEHLDSAQRMTPTLLKFVTFNPLEMLDQPFTWVGNNPRYDRFPEFLFKSGLFSEGNPGGGYLLPGQCILGCALILLGFAAFGLRRTLHSTGSPAWPISVAALGFISAQIVLVATAPFACHQNARLSIILIIPFVYFAVKGIELSQGRLQSLGKIASGIFIGLCVLFILTQPGVLT